MYIKVEQGEKKDILDISLLNDDLVDVLEGDFEVSVPNVFAAALYGLLVRDTDFRKAVYTEMDLIIEKLQSNVADNESE